MTERLYYRDGDLLEFDAAVVAHAGDATRVVLDRTAFYPTSGGQPHDLGTLGDARVIDVVDADTQVIHVLDRPLAVGAVHGRVEAARRRDHMEQHTAQHLLSALAHDRFGWPTESVHFGADHSTIEFGVADVSAERLNELEHPANREIAAARSVFVTFEDAMTAAANGLRKPSERGGEIRVITIDGIDRSACGGTHVASTAAIGVVVLLGLEKVRHHTRVSFVAGGRARTLLHALREREARLANVMHCAPDELADLVSRRADEWKAARDMVEALEREVASARFDRLAGETPRDADGIRRMRPAVADASPALLRAMVQRVAGEERTLFIATTGTPPTIYFATSSDSGIDAGAELRRAVTAVHGRGGGNARAAQGSVPDHASADAVAADLAGASHSSSHGNSK